LLGLWQPEHFCIKRAAPSGGGEFGFREQPCRDSAPSTTNTKVGIAGALSECHAGILEDMAVLQLFVRVRRVLRIALATIIWNLDDLIAAGVALKCVEIGKDLFTNPPLVKQFWREYIACCIDVQANSVVKLLEEHVQCRCNSSLPLTSCID
jgi:hypothetical protein